VRAPEGRYRLLGVDDDVTTCEHCGRKNLKRTVVLSQIDEDGDEVAVVRFGCDCAARAMRGRVSVTAGEVRAVEGLAVGAATLRIEAELRARKVFHVQQQERPDLGMTFVRHGAQRWGRAFDLADGRTYLHFDFVVSSREGASRVVPGVWTKLGESRFVGRRGEVSS
jgi:hypothetical protein